MRKTASKGAFTLIEILIVVAIIAILIAIGIPLIAKNLEEARVRADEANERVAWSAFTAEASKLGSDASRLIYDSAATLRGRSVVEPLYYDTKGGKWSKDVPETGEYGQCASHSRAVIAAFFDDKSKSVKLGWRVSGKIVTGHDDSYIAVDKFASLSDGSGSVSFPAIPGGGGSGGTGDLSPIPTLNPSPEPTSSPSSSPSASPSSSPSSSPTPSSSPSPSLSPSPSPTSSPSPSPSASPSSSPSPSPTPSSSPSPSLSPSPSPTSSPSPSPSASPSSSPSPSPTPSSSPSPSPSAIPSSSSKTFVTINVKPSMANPDATANFHIRVSDSGAPVSISLYEDVDGVMSPSPIYTSGRLDPGAVLPEVSISGLSQDTTYKLIGEVTRLDTNAKITIRDTITLSVGSSPTLGSSVCNTPGHDTRYW